MDDPSEDSRPGQPGVVKKIFITISQVKKIALNVHTICLRIWLLNRRMVLMYLKSSNYT